MSFESSNRSPDNPRASARSSSVSENQHVRALSERTFDDLTDGQIGELRNPRGDAANAEVLEVLARASTENGQLFDPALVEDVDGEAWASGSRETDGGPA